MLVSCLMIVWYLFRSRTQPVKPSKNHCCYNEFICFHTSGKIWFLIVFMIFVGTCFGIDVWWFVGIDLASLLISFGISFSIFSASIWASMLNLSGIQSGSQNLFFGQQFSTQKLAFRKIVFHVFPRGGGRRAPGSLWRMLLPFWYPFSEPFWHPFDILLVPLWRNLRHPRTWNGIGQSVHWPRCCGTTYRAELWSSGIWSLCTTMIWE